jgi:hypothetical protein
MLDTTSSKGTCTRANEDERDDDDDAAEDMRVWLSS